MRIGFFTINDKILVLPATPDQESKGGIIIPDEAQEKAQHGKVISVGPGRLLDNGQRAEMQLRTGDEVFWVRYAGTEIKLDDEDYIVLREADILGVNAKQN